jgi:hypothetical protein
MRRLGCILLVIAALAPWGTASASSSGPWVPAQGLHWQYQLQGKVKTTLCIVPKSGGSCVRPDVYDVDLYARDGVAINTVSVAQIHAAGARAVCYVDAGSWENFRPDSNAFPDSIKGVSNGWPGERWLDIRATSVLFPIMDARVAKCVAAGFDAVEFDNADGYTNHTGFPLTADDQLTFDIGLADIAHAHGLSVGLKNDLDQLTTLQNTFDFAINEQCAQYTECNAYDGWLAAGKAVVEVEYTGSLKNYCADAALHHRDAIHKALALNAAPWKPCR